MPSRKRSGRYNTALPHLTRAINRFTTAAIGLQKVREKDGIARAHLLDIQDFFHKQGDSVAFRFMFMRDFFPELAPEVRMMEVKKSIDPAALKRWDDIWKSVEVETTGKLQQVVKGIEQDALLKGAAQLATQMKFDAKTTFSLSNPRAVAFFRKTGGSVDYIRGIQATTAESLKRVITTGLDEGWSYNDTAKEIRKLFDGPISRERAQRIATYETGQSYEAGNRMFAESLEDDGITMEEHWMTSHDEKVRPEHAANEAEGWVPMGHVFSSGDTESPTDPGCRCYMQYRQARA
jgi:hypothetical protein